MSLPGTFKRVLALASGATVTAISLAYSDQLFRVNNQISEPDAFLVSKINKAFEELQKDEKCDSLLKKHLTPALLEKLEYKATKLGGSLYDIIRSDLNNSDAKIGIYAADVESYEKFAPLFNAVISDWHGFQANDKQPPIDSGEYKLSEFAPLDPNGKYIKSTRIRCSRSVKGYPFSALLTADDYLILEQKIKIALSHIDDSELKGIYSSLGSMPKKVKNELLMNQSVFDNSGQFLKRENVDNFWPTGRGIYHNSDKTFMVSVNDEDHFSVTSLQEGSNVGKVLDRLIRGMKTIESNVELVYDNRLGWLTTCPTNLGCAVRASVQIRLPKLTKKTDFMEICDQLNLQACPAYGDHSTDNTGGYYVISNKKNLGLTQYEAVKEMYDGVKELIRMEDQSK